MVKKFLALRSEKVDRVAFRAEVSNGELQLEVHDIIGADFFGEGVTHAAFAKAVKEAPAYDSIRLSINSPGGDVFDAVGIFNLLRQQGKPVNVYVDGLAASAASVIAMAGDTITMGEGSVLMIHNAMALAFGNANDMREMAGVLDTVSGSIADIYAGRTKQAKADVQKMMDAETWMDATEAVANGFADSATAKVEGKAQALAAAFDLAVYNNVPEAFKIVPPPVAEETAEYVADPVMSVMRKRIEIMKKRS